MNLPTNNCMFNGIVACSRDYLNFSRVVCSKHAREVFNITGMVRRTQSYRNSVRDIVALASTEATRDPVQILPFPFHFIAKSASSSNSQHTYNGKQICLDTNSLVNSVTHFINIKNLLNKGYNARQIHTMTEIIIAYIQDQAVFSQHTTNPQGAMNYQMFKVAQEEQLRNYWEKPMVTLKIVNYDNTMITFPLYKLPLFYQAMLIHFEVSEHNYTQINKNRAYTNLISNVICNAATKYVETFNQTTDVEICRYVPGAVDFVSPLIFPGSATHTPNLNYEPFQRPIVERFGFNIHTGIPTCP